MNQDGNNQLIKTKKKDTQTDNKECDAPESNITDMHQFTMIIDDLECQLKQFKHIVKMNQQLISELKTKLSEKIVQIEIQNKAISNVIRKVENIDLQNNKQLQDIKSKSQSVQTQFVNEHNNSTNYVNTEEKEEECYDSDTTKNQSPADSDRSNDNSVKSCNSEKKKIVFIHQFLYMKNMNDQSNIEYKVLDSELKCPQRDQWTKNRNQFETKGFALEGVWNASMHAYDEMVYLSPWVKDQLKTFMGVQYEEYIQWYEDFEKYLFENQTYTWPQLRAAMLPVLEYYIIRAYPSWDMIASQIIQEKPYNKVSL